MGKAVAYTTCSKEPQVLKIIRAYLITSSQSLGNFRNFRWIETKFLCSPNGQS